MKAGIHNGHRFVYRPVALETTEWIISSSFRHSQSRYQPSGFSVTFDENILGPFTIISVIDWSSAGLQYVKPRMELRLFPPVPFCAKIYIVLTRNIKYSVYDYVPDFSSSIPFRTDTLVSALFDIFKILKELHSHCWLPLPEQPLTPSA